MGEGSKRWVIKLYPWGNEESYIVICIFSTEPRAAEISPTTAVKVFPSNGYGAFNSVGNVWQWSSDRYANDYYSKSPRRNPYGANATEHKVRRGGAWNVIQSFRLRCANRGALSPESTVHNVGFRCVL